MMKWDHFYKCILEWVNNIFLLHLTDLNSRKLSISKLFNKIHIPPVHYVRNKLQDIQLGCTQCYTTRELNDSFPNQIVLAGILYFNHILSYINIPLVHPSLLINLSAIYCLLVYKPFGRRKKQLLLTENKNCKNNVPEKHQYFSKCLQKSGDVVKGKYFLQPPLLD